MTEQFTIFFGNTKVLTSDDRECTAPGMAAFSVWDALCTKFLRVDMYDSAARLVRKYDNT